MSSSSGLETKKLIHQQLLQMWTKKPAHFISPSLLSSDFADLKNEIQKVSAAGADLLHVDVMDGHFVPNLTLGMPIIKAMKAVSSKPLDVHLMIEQPEKYLTQFIEAGSDILTIHIESTNQPLECLKTIKANHVKVGLTLKPKTSLDSVLPFLADVDLILIMSVEPGFGGQSFMAEQLEKVKTLKKIRDEKKLNFLIEIDGGINAKTAASCWQAGADILVAGSAVFTGEKTVTQYQENIKALLY